MFATGATAGSSTYDLNPLLNEPHPFAQVPITVTSAWSQDQIPNSAQVQNPTSTLYSQTGPTRVLELEKEDTLLALLGFTTSSETPFGQVVNSTLATVAKTQMASADPPHAKIGDPSFITIGGGWFDFNDNEQAAEFRVEWRGKKIFWILKPFVGAIGTSDAAIYGYGGFLTDLFFGRRIVVTPSLAAGLYEDGDGKVLGSVIEFRSGLEIGWRFDNRSRLSAIIYHVSNASINDNNPGTEVFSIGYSIPLD